MFTNSRAYQANFVFYKEATPSPYSITRYVCKTGSDKYLGKFQNFTLHNIRNIFSWRQIKKEWLGRILEAFFGIEVWFSMFWGGLKTVMHRPFFLRYVKKKKQEQQISWSGRILTSAALEGEFPYFTNRKYARLTNGTSLIMPNFLNGIIHLIFIFLDQSIIILEITRWELEIWPVNSIRSIEPGQTARTKLSTKLL